MSAATGAGAAPVIEVSHVSVRYGEVRALEDVTLTIPAGRVTGLVGMNGSGKSTLFKTLTGVLRPTSGHVTLGGMSPADARKRRMIGYMPQSEEVDWTFPISVRDVVMMGRYGHLRGTRRPRRADHEAVDAALERVELMDLADRQIGRLSGGQRKRAFVARSLAQDAEVLLLDEPFAGVDKRSEAMIVRLLRDAAAEGRTVLVSTHDLHALPQLADSAALLLRRLVFHGPVDQALQPDVLASAFGLDVLGRND